MIIKLTQNHISEGVIGSPDSCPVALALESEGFIEPRVGYFLRDYVLDGGIEPEVMTFTNPRTQERLCVRIDDDLADFIGAYDDGRYYEPTSFHVHFENEGDENYARHIPAGYDGVGYTYSE